MIRATTLLLPLLLATSLAADDKVPRPDPSPGTVTLPLAEYDRLVERASRPPKVPSPPPVPYVLAAAQIDLRAGATDVRGSIRLDGVALGSGPTLVPVIGGPTLLDVRAQGRSVPMTAQGQAQSAIVDGPGAFSLSADWGAALENEPGQVTFALPVPAAGSVKARLDVPGERADVRAEPGMVVSRSSAGGRTVVEFALTPGTNTRFRWSAREGATTPVSREARFLADVKTLVTIGEADLRMASLIDLNLVQGAPSQFDLVLPEGYELTGASGPTLERAQSSAGRLSLFVRESVGGRHQFLVTLERANDGGSYHADVKVPEVAGAQRETGEVAFEAVGTLDLRTTEGEGLHRVDVREVSTSLTGLAREPLLAAFRYHRGATATAGVGVDVQRFPSAAVLGAIAERAVVTTMTTVEGRALTDVSLTIRNRAQPFLRVALPEGASLLTAEVGGEGVKPAKGDGGTRVPLLRAGFRPEGSYVVSFVYLSSNGAFQKKGDASLTLPRMDIPIELLEWEVFAPERLRIDHFGGNALAMPTGLGAEAEYGVAGGVEGGVPGGVVGGVVGGLSQRPEPLRAPPIGPGQIGGLVVDPSGAAVPGATVRVRDERGERSATSGSDGGYVILNASPGKVELRCELTGFRTITRRSTLLAGAPLRMDFPLEVGALTETVMVAAEEGSRIVEKQEAPQAPSANVLNLQRRAAGVLPVPVEVPRAGTSYRFARPLVLDEETQVTFRYRRR